MNNQMILFFAIMWALMAAFGIFGYLTYFRIKEIIDHRRRKKTLPYLEDVTPENICKGPHTWDETKLMMYPLPTDTYRVCTDCGFVSTAEGEHKLNGPGLEVYKGQIVRRDARLKQIAEVEKRKFQMLQDVKYRLVRSYWDKFGIEPNANAQLLSNFFDKALLEAENAYTVAARELSKLD
jgi:hypothetical protein